MSTRSSCSFVLGIGGNQLVVDSPVWLYSPNLLRMDIPPSPRDNSRRKAGSSPDLQTRPNLIMTARSQGREPRTGTIDCFLESWPHCVIRKYTCKE